ncbi:MAG: hypothetical protein AAB425_04440, partial [Bdellovibrionota bacterium]
HLRGARLTGTANVSAFGLEAEKSFADLSEWLLQFNFRIFGLHVQGTNLTLFSGWRAAQAPTRARNLYAGASLTIYFARYFGLDLKSQYYFPSADNSSGVSISGWKLEPGAFLDFSFLRIFGRYHTLSESAKSAALGTELMDTHKGIEFGTKVFF